MEKINLTGYTDNTLNRFDIAHIITDDGRIIAFVVNPQEPFNMYDFEVALETEVKTWDALMEEGVLHIQYNPARDDVKSVTLRYE